MLDWIGVLMALGAIVGPLGVAWVLLGWREQPKRPKKCHTGERQPTV